MSVSQVVKLPPMEVRASCGDETSAIKQAIKSHKTNNANMVKRNAVLGQGGGSKRKKRKYQRGGADSDCRTVPQATGGSGAAAANSSIVNVYKNMAVAQAGAQYDSGAPAPKTGGGNRKRKSIKKRKSRKHRKKRKTKKHRKKRKTKNHRKKHRKKPQSRKR